MGKNNKKYNIVVFGAGGTGSFFIKEIARYLCGKSELESRVSITIVDGDIVEKKNISRGQAFSDWDIGHYKVSAMAEAVKDSFDIDIRPVDKYILNVEDIESILRKTPFNNGQTVLIGALDNVVARKLISDYFKGTRDCVYYDSGNEFSDGQAVYAERINGITVSPDYSYYYGYQIGREDKNRDELSCTELNAVAPQHYLVNVMAGLNLLSAVIQLLENDVSIHGISTFDVFKQQWTFNEPSAYHFVCEKSTQEEKKMLNVENTEMYQELSRISQKQN